MQNFLALPAEWGPVVGLLVLLVLKGFLAWAVLYVVRVAF